jgi:glycosyltransferase involved in cell wall biosynthesis
VQTASLENARGRFLSIGLTVHDEEGGTQRYNRQLAAVLEELSQTGMAESGAFVSLWDDTRHSRSSGRFSFTALGRQGRSMVGIRKVPSIMRGAAHLIGLRSRGRFPDLVVLTHVVAAPLAPLVKLLAPRSRVLLVLHGAEAWRHLPAASLPVLRRSVDRLVPVSAYTAGRFIEANRLDIPFTRIPCAVETRSPVVKRERVPGRIVTVARLRRADRDKNIDLLISAMPIIGARHQAAELFVIGEGNMRLDLQRLAESLGVGSRVHCLGWVTDDERDRLYASSQLFALPSTREGFGIAYLEAWLHGLPVIAGNAGAAPEVVRDGIDGLIVPPDQSLIANAVIRLLDDPGRCDNMGRAGAGRVLDVYGFDSFSRRWMSLLAAELELR